jgi:hypothetical protein
MFRGKVVWDGVVETFEVPSHAEVKRLYAFSCVEDNGDRLVARVSEAPKINSPQPRALSVETYSECPIQDSTQCKARIARLAI